jgi:arabinogalactan oligomer/maltooligosaccharide transport system permease protein
MDSVLFHSRYSQGTDVQRAGFPFWQPFVYLFSSFFFNDNRNAIFVITLDVFITVLAIYGLRRAWRLQRVMVLWLMVALVFLLLWNTKWPQYLLILTAPLCYAAAEGLKTLRDEFVNWLKRRRAQQPSAEKTKTRAALPWLLPGLIALTVLALLPLLFQVMMSLTDFSAQSIRDGINGGVFREVWLGLSGQHAPADLSAMRNNKVDYVGATLLTTVFGGTAGEVGGAMAFSVVWTICSVALQTALGISVALLLNRPFVRGANVWRALFVLPWAIPEFVGGLAWRTMFHPNSGVLAAITGSRVLWQESSGLAFAVLLIAGTWMGFPIIMLAATAALKLMPADANEAAAIDGATGWQAFWWITLPLMLPLVVPALIIRVISTFNQFYLFYSMETYEGTLATLSYFVFTPLGGTFGMGGGLYAVSAALNVFIVAVLLLLLVWFKRRREVTEGVTYA